MKTLTSILKLLSIQIVLMNNKYSDFKSQHHLNGNELRQEEEDPGGNYGD